MALVCEARPYQVIDHGPCHLSVEQHLWQDSCKASKLFRASQAFFRTSCYNNNDLRELFPGVVSVIVDTQPSNAMRDRQACYAVDTWPLPAWSITSVLSVECGSRAGYCVLIANAAGVANVYHSANGGAMRHLPVSQ